MNARLIGHVLGTLILFMGAAMTLPLGWSLYYEAPDRSAFLAAGLVSAALGLALRLWGRSGVRVHDEALHQKEALVVVGLGWLVASLVAALPLAWSGSFPSLTDAFFEATSGLTTTGATVLTEIEAQPPGVLFWRSFLHWLGGMGIIVLAIAILPRLELGGMQLLRAEASGTANERLRPRLRNAARLVLFIYLGLSALEALLLLARGLSLFDALIQTFGTIATAGFSNYNASIAAFQDPVVEVIIGVFMILAGTNFALHYRAILQGRKLNAYRDPEFRAYVGSMAVLALLLTLILARSGARLGEAARHGLFQAIAIVTTTGFTSTDYTQWPEAAQLLILLAMFIGGSAGSTSSSIKVVRWVIVGRYVRREIIQLLHPKAVLPIRLGDRTLSEETVRGAVGFVLLYLAVFAAATVVLALSGLDAVTAASAAAACLGNIGPGLGPIGPSGSYAAFAPGVKWLLSLLMIAGRLEIYTLLVLLMPSFWRRA